MSLLLQICQKSRGVQKTPVSDPLDVLDATQSRSKAENQPGYTGILRTENGVSERVLALYGQPGFETWEQIGKVLRISRGSAWSLAHGLRKPDPRTLEYLECAEWRLNHLCQATANLAAMIGEEPHLPTVFARALTTKVGNVTTEGGA